MIINNTKPAEPPPTQIKLPNKGYNKVCIIFID